MTEPGAMSVHRALHVCVITMAICCWTQACPSICSLRPLSLLFSTPDSTVRAAALPDLIVHVFEADIKTVD